jgi:protein SMG7
LNFVQIDQMRIYFDPSSKKFVMAKKPPVLEANEPPRESSDVLKINATGMEHEPTGRINSGSANLSMLESDVQLSPEGDDDEEIVFKPTASEKFPMPPELSVKGHFHPVQTAASWPTSAISVSVQGTQSVSAAAWPTNGGSVPMHIGSSISAAGG